MRFNRSIWVLPAILAVFLLGGCSISLAEDVTPPPNYRTPTPLPEQPEQVRTVYPLVPPDPQEGAALYLESCEPCHGVTGLGDGSLAGNLSNPAPMIGSPGLARQARPMDWYHVVTNGRMERQMPPFTSLSDRERWDVVAYALTLSITDQDRVQGQELYEATCANCHGQNGLGDGPRAASLDQQPANWGDQERLAAFSTDDMIKVFVDGADGHPVVGAEWSAEEQYAAASYVRLLSFANERIEQAGADTTTGEPADAADQPAQPEEALDAALESITIGGKITNASQGGSLPENMQVTISAFDGMTPAFEATGSVAQDGTYTVEDVDYSPEYVYFAQVDAGGVTFNSDILHGNAVTGAEVDLPIQIYNTTSDTAALRTDRLHVFFDFSQPGLVQVINLYILSNTGDTVVVPAAADASVVNFSLPAGALDLQFQDGTLGDRFIETDSGFGDTWSIAPGEGQHQVLFAYSLPYDRKLDLEILPPAPVESAIVMVPPGGVRLKSDLLMDAGRRDVQGMSFQMYQATTSLAAGQPLKLSLSGRAGSDDAAAQNAYLPLIAGGAVFGLALLGAGLWLYRQRSALQLVEETAGVDVDGAGVTEASESSESLLDAIVALDDLHASGKLADPVYQERRDGLKERLAQALRREENS